MKNIKLVTLMQRKGEEVIRTEKSFKSLNELKQYIKNCGGIKSFKWNDTESQCVYFITGECEECNECYYEYKYGKYNWYDCNGYKIREVK